MKYYVLDKRQIDSENIDLFTEKNYVIEQLKSLYNVVFSDKEHYETSFGSLKFYSGMRKEILNMIGIGEVRLLDLRDGERKG